MSNMNYTMSRDYEALYKHLCDGHDVFGLVDYEGFTQTVRDVVHIRRHGPWDISIGARGITYGEVRRYHSENYETEFDAFVAQCSRANLEWVVPPASNDEPHIHTVYEARGGGYICSGCEMRFVTEMEAKTNSAS